MEAALFPLLVWSQGGKVDGHPALLCWCYMCFVFPEIDAANPLIDPFAQEEGQATPRAKSLSHCPEIFEDVSKFPVSNLSTEGVHRLV